MLIPIFWDHSRNDLFFIYSTITSLLVCFHGHLHRITLVARLVWIIELDHGWSHGTSRPLGSDWAVLLCFTLLGHSSWPFTPQRSIKKLTSEVVATAKSNGWVYASLLCVVPEMLCHGLLGSSRVLPHTQQMLCKHLGGMLLHPGQGIAEDM